MTMQPLTLHPYQDKTVSHLSSHLSRKEGAMLKSDVGNGKTVVIGTTLFNMYQQDKSMKSVVCAPRATLTQWMTELQRVGFRRDEIGEFMGSKRHKLSTKHAIWITTINTLHSDISRFGKKSVLWKRGLSCLVLDESQNVRNGQARSASQSKNDDPKKQTEFASLYYSLLLFRRAFPKAIVMEITATPFINHYMDIYCQFLLFYGSEAEANRHLKSVDLWRNSLKGGGGEVFTATLQSTIQRHVVVMQNDRQVPPVKVHEIFYEMSAKERVLAIEAHAELCKKFKIWMDVNQRAANNPGLKADARRAFLNFMGCFTRNLRGLIHPDFYQSDYQRVMEVEEAREAGDEDEEEEQEKNKDDEKGDGTKQEKAKDKISPAEFRKLKKLLPIPDILNSTKLQAVIKELSSHPLLKNYKSVVFSKYRGSHEILAHHFQTSLHQPVAQHYGGRSTNITDLEQFRNNPHCLINFITRGSGGAGLSLDCSQVVLEYDSDWSAEMEKQNVGRVVRPAIQKKWDWNRVIIRCTEPTVQDWLILLQQEKSNQADFLNALFANATGARKEGDEEKKDYLPQPIPSPMLRATTLLAPEKSLLARITENPLQLYRALQRAVPREDGTYKRQEFFNDVAMERITPSKTRMEETKTIEEKEPKKRREKRKTKETTEEEPSKKRKEKRKLEDEDFINLPPLEKDPTRAFNLPTLPKNKAIEIINPSPKRQKITPMIRPMGPFTKIGEGFKKLFAKSVRPNLYVKSFK